MSKQLRLGIDCDGVLSDFTRGYLAVLKEASGGKMCSLHESHGEPDCWYWPTKYGYTKEEDAKAWELIKKSPTFWADLPAYLETAPALDVLSQIYAEGHEVYFITNRPGLATHAQTSMWLMQHGYPMPLVLVREQKGPVVQGLGINFFIDDKPSNCYEVRDATAHCRVFLLSRPWNQDKKTAEKCAFLGIEIIATLREFFDVLAKEEHADAVAE